MFLQAGLNLIVSIVDVRWHSRPMAVGPNRQKSIELLLEQHDLDLIISDDGLQHLALNRQLEWIVLDNNRGLGNEKILPEGYLREPKSRLDDATVIEHAAQPHSNLNMHLAVAAPYLLHPQQELIFDRTQNYGFLHSVWITVREFYGQFFNNPFP